MKSKLKFFFFAFSMNVLALLISIVCFKTMKQFAFRSYKHSNLTVSQF